MTEPTGIVRLWDQDFNLLASHPSDEPRISNDMIVVKICGDCELFEAVWQQIRQERDMHLTYDPDARNLDDWRSRRGGMVTGIERDDHLCECGQQRIITTTIRAATYFPAWLR